MIQHKREPYCVLVVHAPGKPPSQKILDEIRLTVEASVPGEEVEIEVRELKASDNPRIDVVIWDEDDQ